MIFLLVKDNIVLNIIEATPEVAYTLGACPYYDGAEIGQPYFPPPAPMTIEEAMLDKLTELEHRQDLRDLGLTEGGAK